MSNKFHRCLTRAKIRPRRLEKSDWQAHCEQKRRFRIKDHAQPAFWPQSCMFSGPEQDGPVKGIGSVAGSERCHLALTHFVELRKKLPDPAEDGKIGGWAIAILPFMDETVLADGLSGNPPLASPSPLDLARKRPFIMACPSAYEGDSIIATVPTSHYSAILTRKGLPKLAWQLGELPTDSRIPWVISPEAPFGGPPTVRLHSGGYNTISGSGGRAYGVEFIGPD